MKRIFLPAAFFLSTLGSFAQSSETTIPEGTQVSMILKTEIREGKNKTGESAQFVVENDVKVNGTTVISANTPIHATVTNSKNRELRVDIYDVKAVDGTVVKLNDCWIFTTASENLKSKGALLVAGVRKNCSTIGSIKIKR